MPYSSEEKPPISDMMMVFACFNQSLHPTALRQLAVVVQALLAMTGRVTMLGLSRWASKGGSYRMIQRFFNTTLTWSALPWLLIHSHLWASGEALVAAGDDAMVTKSGKCTHGLDRFFCSIYRKVMPGLGFLSLSLISVKRRVSYPRLSKSAFSRCPVFGILMSQPLLSCPVVQNFQSYKGATGAPEEAHIDVHNPLIN